MEGSVWRHLDWLPGSASFRPDWRLRRAEYLLATRSRFIQAIDDHLIKQARTDLAKKFRCNASAPARSTTIQSVHELSRTSDSPLRWRLEAYLLSDLSFREIGEILKLDSRFVTAYHNLAFDVRPRSKATDWLTCYPGFATRQSRPSSRRGAHDVSAHEDRGTLRFATVSRRRPHVGKHAMDGGTEPLRSHVAARRNQPAASASTQSRGTDRTAAAGTRHTPGNPATRTEGSRNGAR